MKKTKHKYLTLFLANLTISAFTFGGGYVIVTFMKRKFVDELGWLEEDDMLNMVAIAQSSPGAVAVNAAILTGYRIGGVPGAALAILGTIIPPLVIISIISVFYASVRSNTIVAAVLKGMQSGIAAVIADVTINLFRTVRKEGGLLSITVMVCAFLASFCFSVNVVWIIVACAVFGFVRTFITVKKAGAK